MTRRQIEIANAEESVTRWTIYLDAASANNDAKRVAYGAVRLANANARLAAWRRP